MVTKLLMAWVPEGLLVLAKFSCELATTHAIDVTHACMHMTHRGYIVRVKLDTGFITYTIAHKHWLNSTQVYIM